MSAPAPSASPPPQGPSFGDMVLVGLLASCWLFAFSPTPLAWASVPGIVGMLLLAERPRSNRAAVGWIVGFGALTIGVGYRWIAATIRTFGDLDARLGVFALPVAYLALALYAIAATVHLGLFALLHRLTLRGARRPHPLWTVLLFVACETLPIRFLPWMAGYGVVDAFPLRQLAEWGGVPLVSFAILCLCVPLHEGLLWARDAANRPAARPRAALATLLLGALLYGGGWARGSELARQETAATAHVRVGLVQAGVGANAKRGAETDAAGAGRRARAAYEAGTRRADAAGAELVVWPESALVEGLRLWDPVADRPRTKGAVDDHLRALGYPFLVEVGARRALLLGGYADEEDPQAPTDRRRRRRFNVAMLRELGGADWSLYRKVKLMPFGETMPGASLVPALADLLPQNFTMAAGDPGQAPLVWRERGLSICAFVCYESILPDLVASLAGASRPELLVNLTNDSWYGDTWEPHQHLNFSRLRAVEHRAPMLRATNTGISAIVDATGEVTARLGYDVVGELVADVPLVPRPRTLYATIAPWVSPLAWALAVLGLVLSLLSRRRLSPPRAGG